MDDDDPVKDAAREITAAARPVATGVVVAARPKQSVRRTEPRRRLAALRRGAEPLVPGVVSRTVTGRRTSKECLQSGGGERCSDSGRWLAGSTGGS